MAIDNKNYAIEINGLRKIYNYKKPNAFEALKGINLNIPKHEDNHVKISTIIRTSGFFEYLCEANFPGPLGLSLRRFSLAT